MRTDDLAALIPADVATGPRQFRAALLRALPEAVADVVLFGSRVRGDAYEESDYDVAVLLRGDPHVVGSLSICSLDDDLMGRLKRRAARHGHSAEAETRDTLWLALADEPETDFERLAAELRELTRRRRHTPSEQLQREGREVALDVEVMAPAVAGALTG